VGVTTKMLEILLKYSVLAEFQAELYYLQLMLLNVRDVYKCV